MGVAGEVCIGSWISPATRAISAVAARAAPGSGNRSTALCRNVLSSFDRRETKNPLTNW
jgi:hypothetical protein